MRAGAGLRADAARALKGAWDRPAFADARFAERDAAHQGYRARQAPRAAQFFGGAGRDYMPQYGIRADTFGRISVKARQHAARNPLAVFRQTLTLDEVMASPRCSTR
jgi:acetyl-CoA acetyltransferase